MRPAEQAALGRILPARRPAGSQHLMMPHGFVLWTDAECGPWPLAHIEGGHEIAADIVPVGESVHYRLHKHSDVAGTLRSGEQRGG